MAKTIEFEGTRHEFPDDFSDAEIGAALKSAHPLDPANQALSGTGLSVSQPKSAPVPPALQPWESPPGGMPAPMSAADKVLAAGKQLGQAALSPVTGLLGVPRQIYNYGKDIVSGHSIEPHTVEGNPLEQAQGNILAAAGTAPGVPEAIARTAGVTRRVLTNPETYKTAGDIASNVDITKPLTVASKGIPEAVARLKPIIQKAKAEQSIAETQAQPGRTADRPPQWQGIPEQGPPPMPTAPIQSPPQLASGRRPGSPTTTAVPRPAGPVDIRPQFADVAPPAFSQPEGFTSPGQQMPAMPESGPRSPFVMRSAGPVENPLQPAGAAGKPLAMPPEPMQVKAQMPPMPEPIKSAAEVATSAAEPPAKGFNQQMADYGRQLLEISKSHDVSALEAVTRDMEEYRNSGGAKTNQDIKILNAAIEQSHGTLRAVAKQPPVPEPILAPSETKAPEGVTIPLEHEEIALARDVIDKAVKGKRIDDSGARTLEMAIRRTSLSEREAEALLQDATDKGSKIATGKDIAEAYRRMVPDEAASAERSRISDARMQHMTEQIKADHARYLDDSAKAREARTSKASGLTNDATAKLSATTDANLPAIAKELGLDIAGPSKNGSYLVKEPNGKAWLVGKQGGPMGRQILPSVWTDENVAAMSKAVKPTAKSATSQKFDVVRLDKFNQPAEMLRTGVTKKEGLQIGKDATRMYGHKTKLVPSESSMPPEPQSAAAEPMPAAPPNFEAAFGSPEGAEPNYKPTKEAVIKGHQTVKAKALARAARDYEVSAEKAGTWKLGGPELKSLAEAAGVNPPNSPESLARFMEELAVVPPKKSVQFARGGIVAPKKKSRGRFSRRGVWYGPRSAMPPAPPTPQETDSDMPEMP